MGVQHGNTEPGGNKSSNSTTKWDGGALANMIESRGEFAEDSPEVIRDGHINRLIQSVRKAVNVVMLGQSILVHAGTIGILGPASQCSANCQQTTSVTTSTGTAKGTDSQLPATSTKIDAKVIKEKLEALKKAYPDVAKMPEVEQKALLTLYERDKEEVEKRMKGRVDQTKVEQIQQFKTRLQLDLQTPESISINDFFRQHESIVMGVDEKVIKSGEDFLQTTADGITSRQPTLKTLQEIAKITATPADKDKTVKQDMISISVYEYLDSIKDSATEKVVGSCQAKAKAAIMLLEKVFPEHKDNIFYIKEPGHTYVAIEINGQLYAINNGEAYLLKNEHRYGTLMYSPIRSIMRFAGNDLPEMKDCDLKAGDRCLLSSKQSYSGEKINILIPKSIKEGKKIPSSTEDDGIGESDEEAKLLSRAESVSEFYPGMAKAVKEQVYKDVRAKAEKVYPNLTDYTLRKLVEEETPFFYREAKDQHYMNVGKIFSDVEKVATPDKTARGIVDLIEPEQSGKLVLDFKDVEKYDAETLSTILDAKPEVERSYIFNGISYDLLRAIGYSKIKGNFKFLFNDSATFEKSKQHILELLELQNAPEFDITIVLGNGVVPDEQYFGKILDLLETHPVKVKILPSTKLQIGEEIKERVERLNARSVPLYAISAADDKNYKVERVLAPHLEIDYDGWYNSTYYLDQKKIGRMMHPAIAYLTSYRAQKLIAAKKDKNNSNMLLYYTAAEPGALGELSANTAKKTDITNLRIDARMNVDEARILIKAFKGASLEVYGGEHMTPELAKVLSGFKGHYLMITGLTKLDYEPAHAMGFFRGNALEIRGLRTLDVNAARGLANFKGNRLEFTDVIYMDADAAKVVAGYDVKTILIGLLILNAETAQAISGCKCKRLYLRSIVELDVNSARALAQYDGKYMNLGGLKNPSAQVIGELATAKVASLHISLAGSNLSSDIARLLAGFKGNNLAITGLKAVTTDFAEEIAKFQGKKLTFEGHPSLIITLDTAKKLAGINGEELYLDNLSSLTTEVAEELVKFQGKTIGLWGLKNVSSDALKVLAGFKGEIPDFLHTEKGARKLVKKADKKDLSLKYYKFMSAKAARVIASYEGENLWIEYLRVLGPEVARELVSSKAKVIGLNGLENLDLSTLRILAEYKGVIGLSGLKELTLEKALELLKFKAEAIGLNGLTKLGVAEARILANFGGKRLYLDGISELDVETAKALVSFKGKFISLRGITRLDPEVEKVLANFDGKIDGLLLSESEASGILNRDNDKKIYLNKQNIISSEAAAALSKNKGEVIALNGLKTLTPEVARALGAFEGILQLNGLTTLEPAVARELAKSKAKTLGLNGLTEMTPEVASILAGFEGQSLGLTGISSMSLEAVKQLSNATVTTLYLGLNNSAFTVKIAEELAKFKGDYIALDNNTYIDPQVARALANFKGRGIGLDGLVELGAASAKYLAGFQGNLLYFKGLKEISPEVIEQFRSFRGKYIVSDQLHQQLKKRKKHR